MASWCDLVLLTWNRADLLRPCVERLFQHTPAGVRLIVVDNASTEPEAVQYLKGLRGNGKMDIEVIRRPANDGFSDGMNEGLRRAEADWVCLLNNDILVTQGWLTEMIDVAKEHPGLGLINPMSNEFGLIPKPRETIDDLAKRLKSQTGQWIENWMGVGFCLLTRRQILETVGLLDVGYRFIYFEDADYALRVRRAGFACGIAQGAYVFHLGSASMRLDPERQKIFQANEERFFLKHRMERPKRMACVLRNGLAPGSVAFLRNLANLGHRLWIFHPRTHNTRPLNHLMIKWIDHPRWLLPWAALWKAVFKKKKFHKIFVSEVGWLGLLKLLRRLTHSQVELLPCPKP